MIPIWKWFAVIIIVGVLAGGILVPLNPGITSVLPFSHVVGTKIQLEIDGYNTRFDRAQKIEVWLVYNADYAILSKEVTVLNAQKLLATFALPEALPSEEMVTDLNLLINSDIDGAFVRPAAIAISQKTANADLGREAWSENKIQNLYELSSYRFPFRNILIETIRNTYFHVPLWFSMIILFGMSSFYSYKYIKKPDVGVDQKIYSLVSVGVLYGILGTLTGAVWAKFTWGAYWSWDVKQNMTAVCLLMYFAYFLLRNSIEDPDRRARVSAAYNIFSFIAMIPLLFIIPRLTDSLHPGNGGNPALGGEDLDHRMRMIFYPAILGWTLLGLWIADLEYRILRLKHKMAYDG